MFRLGRRLVGGDKKRSGLGTMLVLALVIVVLAMLLGVGLANYGEKLPLLGSHFAEEPTRTTTSPVVVEGIQELGSLARTIVETVYREVLFEDRVLSVE
jgi:hypothetical protein